MDVAISADLVAKHDKCRACRTNTHDTIVRESQFAT